MKLKTRLLVFNCLPLIIFAAVSLFLGITQFQSALYNEKEGNLRSTAISALSFYSSRGYGDYKRRADGNIWRGMNFNISSSTSIVDELKKETNVDITFFFGDKAVMTSVTGGDGTRLIGLDADDSIKKYPLGLGSQIWCRNIIIDGKNCQAYVIPIHQESDHSVVGALMASQPAAGFNETIRNYILTMVGVMMIVLAAVFSFVRWNVEWFAQKFSEITDKSRQDLLTGVYNKLTFENETKSYLARKSNDVTAVLLILDLDNFKNVNDNFGHQVGDEALKAFARIIIQSFRAGDIIGRIGGDEFMVLMPDMTHENLNCADEIADEIQNSLHELHIGDAKYFSCSIGIGTTSANGFDALYNLADKALYAAKARGKACFVRLSSEENQTDS